MSQFTFLQREWPAVHDAAARAEAAVYADPRTACFYARRALKASGAKDWYSGLGLSLTHQGKLHFIQWHHIIPKSLLKAQG